MENVFPQNFSDMPFNPRIATKYIVDIILNNVYPVVQKIRYRLQNNGEDAAENKNIYDVYTLCCSQIKKCILNLFDILKLEYHQKVILQESRQCTFERLMWCLRKLDSIMEILEETSKKDSSSEEESIFITPMYFVNWIDQAFEILAKLADIVYKNVKHSTELYDQWKKEVIEYVSGLHMSLDELLLSAMTLCKYCLPADQHIIKARCQVVLREAKALISELVEGDVNSVLKVTTECLKLPIMPSNVNVLIDVLKDVLYVLESNTNTALLALLVHCFSQNMLPVDALKKHFEDNPKAACSCHLKSKDDVPEDCSYVKEFDLYNERLLQIGFFAVSCSFDQKRILYLRSGLASLEALDPHLVPALMLSPEHQHTLFLMDTWRQEVQEIRTSVFLIVDPAAFAEKCKHMIHEKLLEIIKEDCYNNDNVCTVINIGCVLCDFFDVYYKYEPDALTQAEKLRPLLTDLNKVQKECKLMSDLLSSENDFIYGIKNTKTSKPATMGQLLKRLKLLYTLICKINTLLHPKENDEQLFAFELGDDDAPTVNKNITHTIYLKKSETYVKSPKETKNNVSRSIFGRTKNVRAISNEINPLSKLTRHLKVKKPEELSFSVKLDELFNNLSDDNGTAEVKDATIVNNHLSSLNETVLYNSPRRYRSSLRKAVLNRYFKLPLEQKLGVEDENEISKVIERESLMDDTTSLQITEILDQLSDISNNLTATKNCQTATAVSVHQDEHNIADNTLTLDINNRNTTITKYVWNIPVNASSLEICLDETAASDDNASNVTQPSNVTTLERINDLDLVESKLNNLKILQYETSL